MGDSFHIIVDRDATLDEAEYLANKVHTVLVEHGIADPIASDCVLSAESGYPPGANYGTVVYKPDYDIHGHRPNGLEIVTGKTVFHAGRNGPTSPVCSTCGMR